MKPIWLIIVVFVIFVSYGITQINSYTGILYAPAGSEGPIELFYGSPGKFVPAGRIMTYSERHSDEFRYEFYLPSGTYPTVLAVTHGSIPTSGLIIQNIFQTKVAEIQKPICIPAFDKINQVDGSTQTLVLPSGGMGQLLFWMFRKGWTCLALVGLIYVAKGFSARSYRFESFKKSLLAQQIFHPSPPLAAFFFILLLGSLFLIPGAIRYDVGDDPAMEMLASGYVTGRPSEYLVFINFIPGLALKVLYSYYQFFPWYPSLLALAAMVGISIVTYIVQQQSMGDDRQLWGFILLVSCAATLVMHLQFTSAAFLLGFGGILIFIFRTSKASLVLSLLLVVSCSLLRYESFVLLAGTFSLAAICFTQRSLAIKIFYGVTAIVLAVGLKEINLAYYTHDPGWNRYVVYNQARGELHQTPKLNDIPANDSVFKSVGWSANDLKMFDRHWLFQDSHVYSVEKLQFLATHLVSSRDIAGCFYALIIPLIRLPEMALFLLVVIGLGVQNAPSYWKHLSIILGPSLVLFGYLALYARLPDRVVLPTLYACAALTLIYIQPSIQQARSKIHFFNIALLVAIIVSLSISTIVSTCKQRALISQQLHRSLDRLKSIQGKTFVSSIHGIRLENLEPFSNFSLTSGLDVIHLLWSFESPSFDLQLQRHHSHELFSSLAHDPHFFLVVPTDEIERGKDFSAFMLEHYGEAIQMKPFSLPDGTLAIFPDLTVLQSSHIQP